MVADGIGVIALKCRSKRPDTRFCPNGSHNATTDLDKVRDWLIEDDRINIAGVLLGTPYLVVDVDGPAGIKAAKAIGPLPKTLTTRTPNGTHRFYRHDAKVKGSRIKLAPELDIIASGYVLLPQSDHPEGGRYESDDWTRSIAKLPERAIEAINRDSSSRDHQGEKTAARDAIAKGGRDNALTSIAGSLRRQGYGSGLIVTALDAIDQGHCSPPLGAKAVRKVARSVSRYAPEHEGLFSLMADVTPRDVAFLWKPYFVRGAVNLLEGDSNVGKTFFLCWLAAIASAGGTLPGQGTIDPQSVLFMSAEDDPETTLVKRFARMGADLTRIWVMNKYMRLDEDVIELIEKHIAEYGVSVIMLDPLLAYMRGGIDMNKANETRPFMARLAELAKAHDVTIIALRHLNKADKDKAIHRGLGSVDITAASRSAVMIGLHPEDEEVRVLVHIKHNLSARGDSWLYTLEGATETRVPKLVWGGTTDLTADDLARKPNKIGRPDNASQDAEQFLKRALAGGERRIEDVVRDAEKRSISDRTLRKAARKLGVIKRRRTWKLAETPS